MISALVHMDKLISTTLSGFVGVALILVPLASCADRITVILAKMVISGTEVNVFKPHLVVPPTMELIVPHVVQDALIMEMEFVKQLAILMKDIIQ